MNADVEFQIREEDIRSEASQYLIRRLSDELTTLYDTPLDVVERYLREARTCENGVFLIACAGDAPIACGMIRPFAEDAQIAEVKRVYVEPQWRGRGVARRLMLALEAEAKSRGYNATALETGLLQPAAIRLYEAIGYTRRPCFGQYKDDPLSACYEKRLA